MLPSEAQIPLSFLRGIFVYPGVLFLYFCVFDSGCQSCSKVVFPEGFRRYVLLDHGEIGMADLTSYNVSREVIDTEVVPMTFIEMPGGSDGRITVAQEDSPVRMAFYSEYVRT